MPRGDGTGPAGAGPMTGRARNNCNNNNNNSRYLGRGIGRGMGRGFGYANQTNDDKELLSREKQALEDRIKDIDSRLNK